jgi:acyl-CoA thioester hydrolase
MGVAHNKCYFEWFEIGRTAYCQKKGFPYRNIEERGFYLVVVEAFCRYRKPLKYDDDFIISTSLQELTSKKVRFSYELLTTAKREPIASGYTVHIATDGNAKVSLLPSDILEKLKD